MLSYCKDFILDIKKSIVDRYRILLEDIDEASSLDEYAYIVIKYFVVLCVLVIATYCAYIAIRLSIIDANFAPSYSKCIKTSDGFCWGFITNNFSLMMNGLYPSEQIYRAYISWAIILLDMFVVYQLGNNLSKKYSKYCYIFFFLSPILLMFILLGDGFILPSVSSNSLGGFILVIFVCLVSISMSLPIAIILAVGRHMGNKYIRAFCVMYIEFFRAVPIVTVLFLFVIVMTKMVPWFGTKLIYAVVAMIVFNAAYVAEIIRGSLQSVHFGQYEASFALNMSYRNCMIYVVLPQVLIRAIPPIVYTCIELFKDATLLMVVGVFDVVNMLEVASKKPEWMGISVTGYAASAILYFISCYFVYWLAQRIERKHKIGGGIDSESEKK